MLTFATFSLKAFCGLLVILSLLARLGALHWSADVLSLFIESYIVMGFVLALAFARLRDWRWTLAAAFIIGFNAAVFLPYLPTKQPQAEASDLTLYMHNLYYLNDDLAGSIAQIKASQPDVIFLMEFSNSMANELAEEFTDYPYQLVEPSRYTMGVALFSKVPLLEPQIIRSAATRIPVVMAGLELPEGQVQFVGAHPWPPLGRWGALHRAQVQAITEVAAAAKPNLPLIVAGDFNASAFSYALKNLQRSADLRDARLGFGSRTTSQLWWQLGFSIDHVFVSAELDVVRFKQEAHAGSDHDGLRLEFNLR